MESAHILSVCYLNAHVLLILEKKRNLILPRIGLYKADRRNMVHVVLVQDNVFKPLCIRQPLIHGSLVESNEEMTCKSCASKGWLNRLGQLNESNPVLKIDNQWISRENEKVFT